MTALTSDLRKHRGPIQADDMAPQTITDCGNFTLDLKQPGFCVSPLFLQTLGPWFPKEMQNLLSSENISLDHSAAVQSLLSLAQARCFWRRLLLKSGLTQGMRQLKPMSCMHLCVVVLTALTAAATHSVNLPHIFGWVLLHNPIACIFFYSTSFPSLCLSINDNQLYEWVHQSCCHVWHWYHHWYSACQNWWIISSILLCTLRDLS